MDIETEIRDLKRRVGDLEGAVNVLTGHMGRLHPDLASLKEMSEARFDGLNNTLERFVRRMDAVNTQVWSLRDDLPDLVGEAVRKSLKSREN